jgi:hypothetical protein
MKKVTLASDPDAYVAGLDGWRRICVDRLRSAASRVGTLEESMKWGHLVYSSNGPVLFIRAESKRVLFGFWRGKRLRSVEPRLRPSGRYEMATLELREGDAVALTIAHRLAKQAVALNKRFGDPRLAAKR